MRSTRRIHWRMNIGRVGRNDDHAKEQGEEKREGAQRVSLILSRTSESGARGGLCVSFVGVSLLVDFYQMKKDLLAFRIGTGTHPKVRLPAVPNKCTIFLSGKGNKRFFLRVWARRPYSLQMRRNRRNKRQKTGSGLLSPRYQPLCNFVPFANTQ